MSESNSISRNIKRIFKTVRRRIRRSRNTYAYNEKVESINVISDNLYIAYILISIPKLILKLIEMTTQEEAFFKIEGIVTLNLFPSIPLSAFN